MQTIIDILSRIDKSAKMRSGLSLSDAAVSLAATGGASKDLLRNWRRAVASGKPVSARLESITAVAQALNVDETWLLTGQGSPDALSEQEAALISAFRALPDAYKDEAFRAMKLMISLATSGAASSQSDICQAVHHIVDLTSEVPKSEA